MFFKFFDVYIYLVINWAKKPKLEELSWAIAKTLSKF
jgi:hypothetical protein